LQPILVWRSQVSASKREGIHIDIGNLARRAARKNAAKPGAVRVIPDKRKKAPRHKKPLKGDE